MKLKNIFICILYPKQVVQVVENILNKPIPINAPIIGPTIGTQA